jgi:hypothetical protein
MSRLRSLFSFKCFERRVLLDLAALRAGGGGIVGATVALALPDWPAPALVVMVACCAVLWALLSADFLERALRLLAFGEVDNVNISARCELEGANTPTHRDHEAEWRRRLRIPVWPDDPGPGLYPAPIPTLRGRLRALVKGEWL